jgi:hypothetical protein
MKRAVSLILLPLLALLLTPRETRAVELNYTLYVLGLPAAVATIDEDMATPAYRMTLRFHTTGVASLFVGDSLEEHTAGRFENGQPAPQRYSSNGHLHGLDRIVDMAWHLGAPVVTSITPPNRAEREDISPALLARTVNPLDAIVLLVQQVNRIGHCEGSSRAYDGRRLQLLEARTAGEEILPATGRSNFAGPALRCDFTDRTLAGFRTGTGRDDDLREHRGTIWLGKVFPGPQRLPVRASVETRWLGDAMIYLDSATP